MTREEFVKVATSEGLPAGTIRDLWDCVPAEAVAFPMDEVSLRHACRDLIGRSLHS